MPSGASKIHRNKWLPNLHPPPDLKLHSRDEFKIVAEGFLACLPKFVASVNALASCSYCGTPADGSECKSCGAPKE